MNRKSRLHLTMAVVAVAGIALAGCATAAPRTPSASAASYAATSSAPLPSSASPTSPQPSATTTAPPAAAECTAAQLKIAYTSNSQIKNGALNGMSHADSVVTFTNTGTAPCKTGGYPGVAALSSAGKQIKQAVRSPGPGVTLLLNPGQTASAMVSADTASCVKPVQVAGLLVTAPNERTSTRLGSPGTLCLGSLGVGTLKRGNAAGLKL